MHQASALSGSCLWRSITFNPNLVSSNNFFHSVNSLIRDSSFMDDEVHGHMYHAGHVLGFIFHKR
jgi:hypothetical protein